MQFGLRDRNKEMQNTGTSQRDRALTALRTDYFRIDDREVRDFIDFASRYAHLITFYNEKNKPDGNWESFYENDLTVKLILIHSFDTESIVHEYRELTESLTDLDEYSGDEEYFYKVIDLLFSLFTTVERWKRDMRPTVEFHAEIVNLIQGRFRELLIRFNHYLIEGARKQVISRPAHMDMRLFGPEWDLGRITRTDVPYVFKEGAERVQKVLRALPHFNDLFYETLNYVEVIKESGERYMKRQLAESGAVQPHIGLFLGFVEAYKVVQSELNSFTGRHLDHYYREILKFQEAIPEPDQLHVVFNLAQNADRFLLPKGEALLAGEDADGNPLKYRLDRDIVLNHTQVAVVKALVQDSGIPPSEIFTLFEGEKDLYFIDKTRNQELVETAMKAQSDGNRLGFAIASSILELDEGDRLLTFDFGYELLSFRQFEVLIREEIEGKSSSQNSALNVANHLVNDAFHVMYHTGEEWFEIPGSKVEMKLFEQDDERFANRLQVLILLDPTDPPIGPCRDEKFAEAFASEHPVFRFTINPEKRFLFDIFNDLVLDHLDIKANVIGARNLRLQNDYGVLDANAPIEPFGPLPVLGSSFYIGHDSLFNYIIDDLKITIDWFDLPANPGGFSEYYRDYPGIEDNETFMASLSLLHKKRWWPSEDKQVVSLFQSVQTAVPDDVELDVPTPMVSRSKGVASSVRRMNNIDIQRFGEAAKSIGDGGAEMTIDYNRNTMNGYLRLELVHPSIAFGHKIYPDIITRAMAESLGKKNETVRVPNDPYTPTIKGVSLNISVRQTLNFREEGDEAYEFYHLHPFGHVNVRSAGSNEPVRMLPRYEEGTYLHLGLENFEPSQTISLLFQIEESGSDEFLTLPEVEWRYMGMEGWVRIHESEITYNTTQGLTRSGLIGFNFSVVGTVHSELLPGNLFWLRCYTDKGIRFVSNFLDVRTQAMSATLDIGIHDPTHLGDILPADSVTGMELAHPEVNSVLQPYHSFGGRPREETKAFYERVSERLRHKDRAQDIWDYEHLVLQRYPNVSRVKCLSHTDADNHMKPGCVTVVVVPFYHGGGGKEFYEPKLNLSQLDDIRSFLQDRCSAFVNVLVRNPLYEQVKVVTKVRFRPGLDEGYHLNRLNDDLRHMLSPWLYEKDQQVRFGESIHGSYILKFIEDRDYVDFVTNFSVYHLVNGRVVNQLKARQTDVEVIPSTERSVLVSAAEHIIMPVGLHDGDEDGIETMIVETDLIVRPEGMMALDDDEGIGLMKIGTDFQVLTDRINISDKEDFHIRIKR